MLKTNKIRTGRQMMAALVLSAGAFALVGCETIQGMGRDVQSGGEAVEDSSEDVQRDMQTPNQPTPVR